MSILRCLVFLQILLLRFFASDGFSNLDLETVTTRAVKITDVSLDVGIRVPSQPQLQLYPGFKFTAAREMENLNIRLFYASEREANRAMQCDDENFSIGPWRLVSESDEGMTYSNSLNFSLARCSGGFSVLFGTIVCCEFSIPSDVTVQEGDILGILHGEQSSLLHEFNANPQLQVLSALRDPREESDSITFSFDPQLSIGYPLMAFEPYVVSGLLSYKLLESMFRQFLPSPQVFGPGTSFTCGGKIESWLLGGALLGEKGRFTLHHWRRIESSVSRVEFTSIEADDIQSTRYPNVYRISTTASQFAFNSSDYVDITYPSDQDVEPFTLYATNLRDNEILHNAIVQENSLLGFVVGFPLLSLEVSGTDCGDDNIFYNTESLADQALLLQEIIHPPLTQNDNGQIVGYLYLFPNISFTEEGSISLWRFAARINDNVDTSEAGILYPSLQVWRKGEKGFRFVMNSNDSIAPSQEPEALNVYRYECNLTYQERDIIAVYQPPADRSRYLLAFVDSSNFLSPNVAFERPLSRSADGVALSQLNPTLPIDDSLLRSRLMEPVMSIRSTSTPRDPDVTLPPVLGPIATLFSDVTTDSTPSLETTVTLTKSTAEVSADQVNSLSDFSPIIIGVVAGVITLLLLIIIALVLVIYCMRRWYKQNSKSYLVKKKSGNNASGSYELNSQSGHQTVGALAYEVPTIRRSVPYLSSPDNTTKNNDTADYEGAMVTHVVNTSDTAQAYEVPVASGQEPPAYEEVGIFNDVPQGSTEEYYDCTLYVPTQEERGKLNAVSNIYYSLKESQLLNSDTSFFEESERYWAPADDTDEIYEQMAMKKYRELPRNQIQQMAYLGSGQFGTVFRGVWKRSLKGEAVEVAIKVLKDGVKGEEKLKFLQEGAITGQFHHPNVVNMHGMVTLGEPVMIILEFLPNGDLRKFLKKNKSNVTGSSNLPELLLGFCQHIAAGMDYLSKKGFVHRDLAARNILLTANNACKITDFGLTRDLEEDDYYISHGGLVPVRWTAPEALGFRKFSTASDVWSYGVVMYEIWSLGRKPFYKFENIEVVQLVKKGHRLKRPTECPQEIYRMMMLCWHPDPSCRPSFSDLLDKLCKFGIEMKPELMTKRNSGNLAEDLGTDLQNNYLVISS